MDGLTSVQIEFLKILEGFLHGKMYQFPQDFTGLTELYQMSSVHKVTATVYEQIYKDVLLKQNENLEIARMFKKNTIHEVVLQAKKTEGFLQIYRTLKEQGVHPLVVKGIICRKLYENRITGYQRMRIFCCGRRSSPGVMQSCFRKVSAGNRWIRNICPMRFRIFIRKAEYILKCISRCSRKHPVHMDI